MNTKNTKNCHAYLFEYQARYFKTTQRIPWVIKNGPSIPNLNTKNTIYVVGLKNNKNTLECGWIPRVDTKNVQKYSGKRSTIEFVSFIPKHTKNTNKNQGYFNFTENLSSYTKNTSRIHNEYQGCPRPLPNLNTTEYHVISCHIVSCHFMFLGVMSWVDTSCWDRILGWSWGDRWDDYGMIPSRSVAE